MTKFKNVLLGFCGLCLLATLPLAQAQDTPGPDVSSPKWHAGQRIQQIYSQLNLTDDQNKQLEANKQQNRERMKSARQEMKAQREAFQVELMKPELDMSKITAIHNQIKAIQSQMEDDKLSSILAVRSILTPEQFSKFVNLMHQHKE